MEGNGYVTSQNIPTGTILKENDVVVLMLNPKF